MVDKPAVKTDPELNHLMDMLCREKGIAYRRMSCGAGHDAKEIAFEVPDDQIEGFRTVGDVVRYIEENTDKE